MERRIRNATNMTRCRVRTNKESFIHNFLLYITFTLRIARLILNVNRRERGTFIGNELSSGLHIF